MEVTLISKATANKSLQAASASRLSFAFVHDDDLRGLCPPHSRLTNRLDRRDDSLSCLALVSQLGVLVYAS